MIAKVKQLRNAIDEAKEEHDKIIFEREAGHVVNLKVT